MRLNLPVVDREYPFPEGRTLVSVTDLKGRIVHCNSAFVDVSGFTREELLGQPHNLIRHPDMPAEAFRDMWETIASGRPWSGAVKNRRKDGSCYWVKANVTPILEGAAPGGYMSVRTRLEPDAARQAEALYAVMRGESDSGTLRHHLSAGQLQRRGLAGHLKRWSQPGLAAQLGLVALVLAASAFAAGLWAGAAADAGAVTTAAALATALAAAIATWRLRALAVSPVTRMTQFCNHMAGGQLGERLGDEAGLPAELAVALNQLSVNLVSVVGDARMETEKMRTSTMEIAAGNQDLSARTEAQAASLEETAASMEQITGTVRQSADAARQAATLAEDASQVTRSGSRAVETVVDSMQQIDRSSHRIGEIIEVIDSIAFQTNILSLNAAVEAARAGAHGSGFAVVAAEVRALARRTAGAAKEVRELIDESGRTVEAGMRHADVARTTIDGALQTVLQVSGLIQQISHSAQEQLTGISQVNEAVGQLDAITQSNASLVQQVAASATSLQGQAETVAAAVRVFTLNGAPPAAMADAVALRRSAKPLRPGQH
jgi:aerotaxis receptor